MSAQPLPVPPEAPRRPARRPAATPAPTPAPARSSLRRRLALVPSPSRARRAPFVVLLLVLLASALIGLLLLNTASAQDSFRLHALQNEDAVLQQQQNALTGMADGLDNPATLAARAAALGMVFGDPPVFLKRGEPIPKGAIRIGNLVYVPGPPPVIPSPAATTPAAKLSTPATKKPVVKKPVVKKPVTKVPVVARTPAVGARVTPTKPTTGTTGTTGTTKPTTKTTTTTRAPVTPSTAPVAGGH